jgi:hypothetical protein
MPETDNPQDDLIAEAEAIAQQADANRSERYSTRSASKIITSNGRLERALNALNTITKLNTEATDKYNRRLIALTWALVGLTVILVVGLVMQIYLAMRVGG